jgi:AcrR family transcriptional regulator
MPAVPQPPLQDTPDPTRQKIMDVAGEIFAEHGFQNATVREICARAGANVAAVNYYFGDKAGLYAAVLRQATCAAHEEAALAVAHGGSPRQILRAIIFAMCHSLIATKRPSWSFRLMAHEMFHPTQALDRVVEEVISPAYQRLRNTLSALLNLPPDHATTRLCAHSIIAQIIHYKASQPVISKVWPELKMTEKDVDMLAQHIYEFSLCSVKSIARQTGRKKKARQHNAH